jgi:hypothetical protein
MTNFSAVLALISFHQRPARVMQVFQENSNQEPLEIYPPGPVSPTQLAAVALDQLHSRLTAAVQDYPIASLRD